MRHHVTCFFTLFLVSVFCQYQGSEMVSKNLVRRLYGYEASHRCPCSCGLTNRKNGRLIGGKVTQFNEYPWVVAILYQGHYYCSGSIITERYILTAAHCIRGINIRKLKVIVGEHVRSFPIETHSKYYDIIYAVFHRNFNSTTYNNDIGLAKLSPKINFKWYARPVCLPLYDLEFNGEEIGIATGWGKTGENSDVSDSLQRIKVKMYSREKCLKKFDYDADDISENMICAGYYNGTQDSCHGDSGGGLYWKGPDNKLDVVGVISWGYGCGRKGLPGIYTHVFKYLDWIAYHTRDSCYCGRRMPRG